MVRSTSKEIAICGAGLAGLGTALALHAQQIPCRIYEASDTPERFGGGSVHLGPNALTVFDRYGVLDRLKVHGYVHERANIMNGKGDIINELVVGDEKGSGYSGLRITRRLLVRELVSAVRERSIPIECLRRIVYVAPEPQNNEVHFTFSDGTTGHAAMLIAADGIHSHIRHQLFPEVQPVYLGALIVGGTIDRKDIMQARSDENAILNSQGMFLGERGTFLLIPENADASVYMAALQRPYPDIGRPSWDTWLSDKSKVDAFFDETREDWPDFIQDTLETLKGKLDWHWPVRSLPRLEQWASPSSHVVLVGDAAHAMAPAAGQGANMAFEDGFTLALALALRPATTSVEEAVAFWHRIRQERIDAVLALTMQLNKMRLPTAERDRLQKGEAFESGDTEDQRVEKMRWLFRGVAEQEERIRAWASRTT